MSSVYNVNSPRGAVQALNYDWDTGTLEWIEHTQGSSSGPATTVDQGVGGGSAWLVKLSQTGTNNDVDANITNSVLHVDDNAGSITVDGPLTDAQLRASPVDVMGNLTSVGTITDPVEIRYAKQFDYDTGAGSETVAAVGIALPGAGGAVAGGTATNPIQVSLANTAANATAVKVDGSAVTQPVSDNAGSLTVDAPVATPVFVRLSDGAAAISALPVTDNGGNLSIDDGGNSITVDGSLTVTQATGTNLHTVVDSGTITTITNVVHVDDNAGSLTVDNPNLDVALSTRLKPADTLTGVTTVGTITNVVHVDDNAGSLTIDSPNLDVALSTRLKPADTLTKVATVDTITNVVHIDDNAGSITIDATALPLPSNAAQETGGNLATLAAKDFATSAKQDTGNASLATIVTNTTGLVTAAAQATAQASLTSLETLAREEHTALLRSILNELRTMNYVLQTGLGVSEDIDKIRRDVDAVGFIM
jgi:hypothetical protein